MNRRGAFAHLLKNGDLLGLTKDIRSVRAFSVIATILCNDLPIDIRSIEDVNKFKSKLKNYTFK